VFGKMSKLRIGSIMKFDSTKSRKEAYNCGRKKGAVKELERLVDEVKKKDYCQDFLYYSILKRLKELKERGV
jgi:argonaute-like protein implicated in RNA metabolism and viral defense